MFAGDLGAACLERSLNGKGDADWGWRPLDFARGDRRESARGDYNRKRGDSEVRKKDYLYGRFLKNFGV